MTIRRNATAAKIQSHPNLTSVTSEPSISTFLNRQLASLDRQYSYEHTVQLGRYRLEDQVPAEQTAAKKLDDDIAAENKKSVRFHHFDPREIWKEEKRARTWGAQFKRWKSQLGPSMPWATIKMMLVDWLYLAALGIGMALLSMVIDQMIEYMQTFQMLLMTMAGRSGSSGYDYLFTYLSWLGYTELLVICSAMFVHYVAPQAIGSGIPEMKTILRGVILKDYLTFRTLISKIVGLTLSLGSGIPIGKMGPMVHIASIVANLLSNLAANFEGAYGNESRKAEMLAAGCAVGVACTFSAPVGGVLFSIEVTTMYFSVRNYWRGFFAAACGATVFRILRVVVFKAETTLLAFYQTHFPKDGFEPEELPFFALIGVFAGFLGVLFIAVYRGLVMFLRQNRYAKKFFQKNWIVYPIVVAFIVASITYPRGYGRFLTGRFKFTRTLYDIFSNCTWSKPLYSPDSPHGCNSELFGSWMNHEGYGPYNVYIVITLFATTFVKLLLFLSALCNTMPIPCGMFMPVFVVGAAYGRLFGEIVSAIFPEGIPGGTDQPIFPGIYAVVGAASLTASITHSVSVAVICCEMTGQYIYIIPLMLAVIIANAVSTYFTPSIYDCIINIKHLPYLPDIPPSNAAIHMFCAEHIMVSPVRFLSRFTTFEDIKNILVELPKLRSFPVVDDSASMMLLGSIARRTLLELLAKQIGDDERKKEAEKRIRHAIETIDKHFKDSQMTEFSADESDSAASTFSKSSPKELHRPTTLQVPSIEGVPLPPPKVPADPLSPCSKLVGALKSPIKKHAAFDIPEEESPSPPPVRKRAAFDVPEIPNHRPEIKGRIPRRSDDVINRVRSDDVLTQLASTNEDDEEDLKARVRPRKTSESFDPDRPIDPDLKPKRKRSRFTIEPVANDQEKRRPNDSISKGAQRRRNAFSASAQGRKDDYDEIDDSTRENRSGTTTPSPKNSWPDLIKDRIAYPEYSHSITRNIAEYVKQAKKRLNLGKKADDEKIEYDLFEDERREWELLRLKDSVELDESKIDPAPFQLVRKTSLYKVHSLFSLLDLNRAYVTDRGRLVGVVALRDLRIAIQQAANGIQPIKQHGGEFIEEEPTIIDVENGFINGPPRSPRSDHPCPEYAQHFVAGMELQRSVEEDIVQHNDILTPALKVVHPSSASLHHYNNHPLLTIQEENDGASLKSAPESYERPISPAGRPSILKKKEPPQQPIPKRDQVAKAVAYLRRQSISVEKTNDDLLPGREKI